MKPGIYLLTVMDPIEWDKKPSESTRNGKRTWGWFSKLEDAETTVLRNYSDIFEEGYYTHAVIELVDEGITYPARVMGWYFADYSKSERTIGHSLKPSVSKIEQPEWAKQICNWGIG